VVFEKEEKEVERRALEFGEVEDSWRGRIQNFKFLFYSNLGMADRPKPAGPARTRTRVNG
jgi:hypothetical protein